MWRISIPAFSECAWVMDELFNIYSTTEKISLISKVTFNSVTFLFMSRLKSHRSNKYLSQITKWVKEYLRYRKIHRNLFTSSDSEQFKSICCITRSASEMFMSRALLVYEKPVVLDPQSSHKWLLLYIVRWTQKSGEIPLQRNSLRLSISDVNKASFK